MRERERPERVKTLDPLILDQNKRLQSFRFESSLGEAGGGWEKGLGKGESSVAFFVSCLFLFFLRNVAAKIKKIKRGFLLFLFRFRHSLEWLKRKEAKKNPSFAL